MRENAAPADARFVQRIRLFDQFPPILGAMQPAPSVIRYSLYGEGAGELLPEFVHIETISARSRLHEWTISPHAHPGIFQLLLLETGQGVLACDSHRFDLAPTSLAVLPSGCIHAFRFAPDAEGWVLSLAHDLLHDPRIAAVFDADPLGGEASARLLDSEDRRTRRLRWLFADLAQELEAARSGTLSACLAAQLGLVLALGSTAIADADGTAGSIGRAEMLVWRFRQLVDRTFREGWSVDRYAGELGTTAPTLTRACRAVLLRAPGEVLRDRILLEAMRSLTYTSASVSQISGHLGFDDPAYFSRFFKQRVGITASAFRRNNAWLQRSASA